MGGSVASRLRRFVGLGNEQPAAFECQGCGEGFQMNRQQCPECDGFDIRRA